MSVQNKEYMFKSAFYTTTPEYGNFQNYVCVRIRKQRLNIFPWGLEGVFIGVGHLQRGERNLQGEDES